MAYNIITIPIVIFFISNGFAQLYYAIKLNKKFPKEHNLNNSILLFILWIIAGLLYPLFYSTDNANIRWFQTLSTIIICVITPFIIFLILTYQYVFVIKKNPDIKDKRNLNTFLKDFNGFKAEMSDTKTYKLNTDLHRKALHLLPAVAIIILWVFAIYVWEGLWKANRIWGISGQDFGRFLILTVGLSGIFIFVALDYIRLSYIFEKRNLYHFLPDNISNLLKKSLKRKEIYEFTKPSVMVLAFVPIFFFLPFSIFAASALIATLGDGAASILGMRLGKRKFPKNSDKTIIGYFAGFITSLIVSILVFWVFENKLSLNKILIISLGGAIIFLVIDLLNPKIDDNILNPLFCALIMVILYYGL